MSSKKRYKYTTPEERKHEGFAVEDRKKYSEAALDPNREIKQEITREQSYTERPQQSTYSTPEQQNTYNKPASNKRTEGYSY
ncbi:MAG TPA: hypothetical protein VFC68_07845, partial [Treponemataceae bacterium]|nr:hypothetical protein [Treponemataceae bacterium]